MSVKFEDYYEVLGVPRSATEDEIRRAYRALARQYHPDLNKDPGAEDRFKQINEAYEVLKDPEKRQQYDLLGENWKAGDQFRPPPGWGGFGGGPGGVRFDMRGAGGEDLGGFSDFFKMFFGQQMNAGGFGGAGPAGFGGAGPAGFGAGPAGFGGGAGGPRAARPAAGKSREQDLTVTLEEVYQGARKTIQIPSPGGPPEAITVRIPPGITDGKAIRLAGKGDPGFGGAPAGDLLLRVRIAAHPRFEVDGLDLSTTVGVAPWEAALGARVNVPTLDGEVVLTIPSGVDSGTRMRLRGKGLPGPGDARGDLYAELQLRVPPATSDEARALYEQLRALHPGFDPRG